MSQYLLGLRTHIWHPQLSLISDACRPAHPTPTHPPLQFARRLQEYLDRDPQLRANPEAILCDHRPYICNSGGRRCQFVKWL